MMSALGDIGFAGRDSEDEHSAYSNEEWNAAHGFDARGHVANDEEDEDEEEGDDDDDSADAGGTDDGGGGGDGDGDGVDPGGAGVAGQLQLAGVGQTVTPNQYPPPPAFTSKHCPPLGQRLLATCNCGANRPELCDTETKVQQFLDDEERKASKRGRNATGCDGVRRAPVSPRLICRPGDHARLTLVSAPQNNLQRKRCYRALAIQVYHFEFRQPLPHCVVAAVRTLWPSATGVYMGFMGR